MQKSLELACGFQDWTKTMLGMFLHYTLVEFHFNASKYSKDIAEKVASNTY